MATNSIIPLLLSSFLFLLLPTVCFSWQVGGGRTQDTSSNSNIRRAIITSSPFLAINSLSTIVNAESNTIPNLKFTTSSSGLQYADVKKGSGSSSPTDGQNVSVDYVMSTTGARYGSKIYSTQDAGAPYRWKLGDGTTIPGLEEAVKDMTPGGIRRVIIPSKLAYQSTSSRISKYCHDVYFS